MGWLSWRWRDIAATVMWNIQLMLKRRLPRVATQASACREMVIPGGGRGIGLEATRTPAQSPAWPALLPLVPLHSPRRIPVRARRWGICHSGWLPALFLKSLILNLASLFL